jgi:uncharacterized RDD family membrane protein YckC
VFGEEVYAPYERKTVVVRLDTDHAPWLRRCAAFAVDLLPIIAALALALATMWLTRIRECDTDTSALDLGAQCGSGISTAGTLAYGVAWLASVVFTLWNLGWRQGRTGASIGKSAWGLRVVGTETGEPVGLWWSLGRAAGHVLNAVPLGLGYLWPLWDRRHQTFADKLVATVCVSGRR